MHVKMKSQNQPENKQTQIVNHPPQGPRSRASCSHPATAILGRCVVSTSCGMVALSKTTREPGSGGTSTCGPDEPLGGNTRSAPPSRSTDQSSSVRYTRTDTERRTCRPVWPMLRPGASSHDRSGDGTNRRPCTRGAAARPPRAMADPSNESELPGNGRLQPRHARDRGRQGHPRGGCWPLSSPCQAANGGCTCVCVCVCARVEKVGMGEQRRRAGVAACIKSLRISV